MTAETRPPADIDGIGHFVLRTGRLLLVYGASAEHVRRRVEEIAAGLGVGAELFINGERLLLSVSSSETYRTRIGRPIAGMGIDVGRFDALEKIAAEVTAGRIDFAEADRRIDALEQSAGLHPGWLVALAVGGTAASLVRLFGGDWPVVAAAFATGVLNTAFRRYFAGRHAHPVVAAFATAFLSGLAGALMLRAVPDVSPIMCLVAAGMILVPGVPLINGVGDLAAGHTGVGLFRLVTATVTVLAIGFALILAAMAVGDPLPVEIASLSIPLWQDFAFAGLASVGYAMLFNVPGRAVLACVLCGGVSHGVRTILLGAGLDLALGTLVAAFVAGLLARLSGRWLAMPWTTFAFAGTVAMIPGSFAFRAAAGGLHIMAEGARASPALVAETLSLVITTVFLTVSVGVGLVLSSLGRKQM
ncbi:threonine/serine ThrE exporter family protein [Acuticoccus sediminis]|nr:threonine/serine exporter family protein [Acuticoccus sediminis]